MAYDTLRQKLGRGDVVILDGACGTELERRGAPMDGQVWCGRANTEYPDLVRELHEDYIDAGADIIITNTYATAPLALAGTDLAGRAAEVNRAAARLATEARAHKQAGRPIWIAGSMSSMQGPLMEWGRDAPIAAIRQSYRDQANQLAEGGVDLFILEMLQDIEQATAAVEAAKATGLPVWAGFTLRAPMDAQNGPVSGIPRSAGGALLIGGSRTPRDFGDVLDAVLAVGGDAVIIMHTQIPVTDAALDVVFRHWDGPIAVYPDSGKFQSPHWVYDGVATAQAYAETAAAWVDKGVQIVGTCCGMGVDHIKVLSRKLQGRRVPVRSGRLHAGQAKT